MDKLQKVFNEKNLNRAKNTLLAAFIFGSVGAYGGITAVNNINAETTKRINAAVAAHTATAQAVTVPVVTATPVATPGK